MQITSMCRTELGKRFEFNIMAALKIKCGGQRARRGQGSCAQAKQQAAQAGSPAGAENHAGHALAEMH